MALDGMPPSAEELALGLLLQALCQLVPEDRFVQSMSILGSIEVILGEEQRHQWRQGYAAGREAARADAAADKATDAATTTLLHAWRPTMMN